eukprot:CAMPEP_0172917580 /NCGR_PEP_ID=MMETSP1075-20121228/198617_1 /TAXON_ID=2916 /ORGANISM="Ceratium fusus, Strain PA161109" /LENGTH=200 /DNA_ID=CAMNT_0013777075 /DNA_START=58 /DNA_END=657 /DNA_ORIENTATION=+
MTLNDFKKATLRNETDTGAIIEVQHTVEELLSVPLEQAIQACDALRAYIEGHEDSASLREEFRESWHPDAPADLRQVLEEVIDPEAFAAAATLEVEAAASHRVDVPLPLPHSGPLLQDAEHPVGFMQDERWQLDEAGNQTAIPVNRQLEAEDDEDDEASSANHDKVKALLALPFDQALKECGELQRYINGAEDKKALERE